ncbi:NAD(P)H-binding protein [Nonomuraea sp. NPDC050790]|uniref:NAD(P)H-binding protein n=1 Tax=Nonomuraea sp. NPDC050790 TaxID=3364371 RepID=UPI003789C09A
MRTIIAGGHGQIALRLAALLGKDAVGLVRNPGHVADVEAAGGSALVCDLEHATVEEVTALLAGAEAAVFAAGAGPNSGAARKDTVDRGAAVLLAEACERAGVSRFVQISSVGAGSPADASRGEVWSAYITAKTAAEDDLRTRSLAWTILRPGRLTNEPGTGSVLLEPSVPGGTVPRADVAAVVAELLRSGAGVGHTLELISGPTPIPQACARYAS